MFIPDYIGSDFWTLPRINRDHYKIQPLLKFKEHEDELIFKKDYIPWIELELNYSWQTWLKELQTLDSLNLLKDYKTEYSQGWKSFNLYNDGWNDQVIENCPALVNWFKQVFEQKFKIENPFLSINLRSLDPGGFIELHKDTEENQSHTHRVIKFLVNDSKQYEVAMFYPNPMDKTKLRTKDYIGWVPFDSGKAIQLDLGNYFAARNQSEEKIYYILVKVNTLPDKDNEVWKESIKTTIGNIKKNARI
tara:strand:+ start:670 stop:1413 length:744 start_codon:yes stop_codon:yes gene_type:complete